MGCQNFMTDAFGRCYNCNRPMEDHDLTDSTADQAIKETEVQLAVVKILAKLPDQDARRRVLSALSHILEAERLVPGVLELFKNKE